MDTNILKSLLSHEFYLANKPRIRASLFEDEIEDLYEVIHDAHEKYTHDLTEDEVFSLWKKFRPVATRAEVSAMEDLIGHIKRSDRLSDDVASDVIEGLWKRETGRQIANLGIELSQGNDEAMKRLERVLERSKDGFLPDDFGEPTTKDLSELLAMTGDDQRWKFNISSLSRHVYGIGPREFGIVFAAPETGKSAFVVSICTGPGGFCEQGAKVLYLGNEEDTKRTMLRAIQAWSGLTRQDIAQDPRKAADRFTAIRDRIDMRDTQDWSLDDAEAYIDKMKPDVVVIDQGDKIHIGGNFGASHERLRELYRRFREMAKRYNCALIVVSQASAEAKGKTRLSPFEMEGSKIGKFAESDLIIGIGKMDSNDVDDSEVDHTRYLTVGKNKLSGWHGTIICQIQPDISRYTE
jgi:KaiC/GvpD/RAD55 family RecA-like ATPase